MKDYYKKGDDELEYDEGGRKRRKKNNGEGEEGLEELKEEFFRP